MNISKLFKYKWATLTNFTFLLSAGFHAWYHHPLTSIALCAIAICSFMYHYYTSIYHSWLETGVDNIGIFHKMKMWQYADVSSIYLLFGIYPYEITHHLYWLLYLIPTVFLIFNKFNLIFKKWDPNTYIWVPAFGLSTIIYGFIYYPLFNMLAGLGSLLIAFMFSLSADKQINLGNYKGYDNRHGFWHQAAAIAFMFIR